MTQPNIPLLRKMVEWVEEQEALTENRKWLQSGWFTSDPGEGWCGTAMCIAGKVALDAGWQRLKPSYTGVYHPETGQEDYVDDVASLLLGLNIETAFNLFDGGNTAADIRRIAEDIAGERL